VSQTRLHPDDIELIVAKMAGGGATVTVQDPRVSNLTRWIATLMGGVALLVMGWVATSINRLNETMSRVVAQNEAIVSILGDHSDRIKELERRNATR
jgi:hypothetical protein